MISIGPAIVKSHGIKIHNLKRDSKPISIKLKEGTIPFAPSVYGGQSSDDVKQTLSITLSEYEYTQIQSLMDKIIDQLSEEYPNVKDKWCSSLKQATDKYAPMLKSQIFVNNCHYFNKANKEIQKPTIWRQLKANAVVNISGCYIGKNNAGILIRLTHLQFDPDIAPTWNPFGGLEDEEFDSITPQNP